jgi:diguanylate cyclase (GGDEF)-like protein/PAS domain S-box-containing protein
VIADRRQAIAREIVLMAVLCAAAYFVSRQFGLMDRALRWTLAQEVWETEEILSVLVVLTVGIGAFSLRRWREADREVVVRAKAQRELAASERFLAQIFASSPHPIMLSAFVGDRILAVNEEFERALEHSGKDVLGQPESELGIWADADFAQSVRAALRRHGRLRNLEIQLRTRAGEVRTALYSAEIIEYDGQASMLGVWNDITERKNLEKQLAHQAFHDPLTNLANRALFHDRVQHALTRAPRNQKNPAVLFLDLDEFKRVNDTLGHAVGDELLLAVTRRLTNCLRVSDTCARLGGDEFAILLEDVTVTADAVHLAERIVPMIRAPFTLSSAEAYVGVSIGIAFAEHANNADELLRNADLAMYLSKSGGRGRFTVFEPAMHAEVVHRVELEAELRGALDRDEFVLEFQPIVEIPAGTVTGIEALLRWDHPTKGQLAPMTFIPIAEESGTIVDIGRWVLLEACRVWRAVRDASPAGDRLTLTVNLSGRQLDHAGLVADVETALVASGVPAGGLILEITESVFVHDDRVILDRLRALKALGVQLAIDDFGTGYSSLSYLQRFPVDILKIDKSFTERLGAGSEESPLSRAVVALGNTMSIRTIAEGIETPAQWDRLRDLGCELGQGFLISRPVGKAQLVALLSGSATLGMPGSIAAEPTAGLVPENPHGTIAGKRVKLTGG